MYTYIHIYIYIYIYIYTRDQTGCCLRPPFLGTPLVPSKHRPSTNSYVNNTKLILVSIMIILMIQILTFIILMIFILITTTITTPEPGPGSRRLLGSAGEAARPTWARKPRGTNHGAENNTYLFMMRFTTCFWKSGLNLSPAVGGAIVPQWCRRPREPCSGQNTPSPQEFSY